MVRAAEDELVQGTMLGPYRIGEALGAGGMGRVWRATLTADAAGLRAGAVVAVKVIHERLLDADGFLKRFFREAQIGKLVRHQNVVRTLDAGVATIDHVQRHFLVTEFVEGRTLRGLLADLGRVPEDLCRHIAREAAMGLAAIHAAGAVHRDLKPENLIIARRGAAGAPSSSDGGGHPQDEYVVKVMDLGVAQFAGERLLLSQGGAFVGSVQYAAPEQFGAGRESIDGRADLHALGVILYELATSQHPYQADDFRGVMRRILDETPRPPAEIDPQLSPYFEELVLQLLDKNPARRFASAAELTQILDEGERSAWWNSRAKAIRIDTRRPLRRIRVARETPLRGRESELARLRSLFERATEGQGQVALIEGEAGIGKSRLVDEFVGALRRSAQDVNYLFGSYAPDDSSAANGGFSTAYREQFGDVDLEETLRDYISPTPTLVPAFAALLRGQAAPADAEPLTKESMEMVFVHATRALAAERPTIVFIDDLHFASAQGRALFAALAASVGGHRVLLVGAARPGLDERWFAQVLATGDAAAGGASRLELPRLGPRDVALVLRDALGSKRAAEELAYHVNLKSDGNPFFIFEILHGLREGRVLRGRRGPASEGSQSGAEIDVPSSLLELIQARVDELAEDDLNALDVASCLGFEFDPAVVAAVLGVAKIHLFQRLARLEKSHRLVHSAGLMFVFDHHEVREAIYAGLPQVLREEYHAAIADAIESREDAAARDAATLDGAVCVDLAEHSFKGAQPSRAERFLDAALTHLEKNHQHEPAVRLADRALAAPGLLDDRRRFELLLRRAGRLQSMGLAQAEAADLDSARSLADSMSDPGRRARARTALGWHFCRVSRLDDARRVLAEAISLSHEAGDRPTESNAVGVLGISFLSIGRYEEARVHFERHLALSREVGDRIGEANATGNLGIALAGLARYSEAHALYERQLGLSGEIGHRQGVANATGNLGLSLLRERRYDEARAQFERLLALSRERGDRRGEASTLAVLGESDRARGCYESARVQCERHLAITREIGYRRGEANAAGLLGAVLHCVGRYDDARAHHERQLEISREIGWRRGELTASGRLGRALRALGRADEARAHHERQLALGREVGDRAGEAEALCELGAMLADADRRDEAAVLLGYAAAAARDASLPGVEMLATARLADLPAGDASAALRAALDAVARHEADCDLATSMEARFLLWKASCDAAHLEQARRGLDHLVANASERDREFMLANVPLLRQIAAAAARTSRPQGQSASA